MAIRLMTAQSTTAMRRWGPTAIAAVAATAALTALTLTGGAAAVAIVLYCYDHSDFAMNGAQNHAVREIVAVVFLLSVVILLVLYAKLLASTRKVILRGLTSK